MLCVFLSVPFLGIGGKRESGRRTRASHGSAVYRFLGCFFLVTIAPSQTTGLYVIPREKLYTAKKYVLVEGKEREKRGDPAMAEHAAVVLRRGPRSSIIGARHWTRAAAAAATTPPWATHSKRRPPLFSLSLSDFSAAAAPSLFFFLLLSIFYIFVYIYIYI